MRKLIAIALLCASVIGCATANNPDAAVDTLRGDTSLYDTAKPFQLQPVKVDKDLIDVTFADQPPVIPHTTNDDVISLRKNTCLGCHIKENYRHEDSVKTPRSHYQSRSGEMLEEVSPGRYFCTQCHVTQYDKAPLVQNKFRD